jgi:RNA polymerase sigma-70 factor (ECF subfamily)
MHPPPRLAEDELILQCKSGSLKYQELLYKHFYGYAMGISLRYSLNRDDALETVNDAFIKVFNAIHKYDSNRPFKAWLRTIIVNTAIDRNRKELKMPLTIELYDTIPNGVTSTAVNHLNAQDILQLPHLQATIFNLYEVDGFSHEEIAAMLNIPVSSSRVYLSRAKERLRNMIITLEKLHG